MFNFPFSQVGGVSGVARNTSKSKFTFNGIVTNLEKTVSTINQVVPLYNQVKPLINNSKTVINALKSNKKNNPFKRKEKINSPFNKQDDIINIEINETKKNETKKENETISIFSSKDEPSKAFFI